MSPRKPFMKQLLLLLPPCNKTTGLKKFRRDSTLSGCSFSSRLYTTKSECKIFCHGSVAREDRQPKLCCGRRYRNFWAGRLRQESNL